MQSSKRYKFGHGVLELSASSLLTQMLLLLAAPLLTRIYEPYIFGQFGVFVGIVSVAMVLVSWRYEMGIALPNDDGEASCLFRISFVLAAISCLLLTLIVVLYGAQIDRYFFDGDIGVWLWLLPLSVFLAAATKASSYWVTRLQRLRILALSRVTQSTSTVTLQLGVGWLMSGNIFGLLGSLIIGQLAASLVLAKDTMRGFRKISSESHREVARRYFSLPSHAITTRFLNAISIHILIIVTALVYGPFIAGIVLLTQRIIVLPVNFLSLSIWQTSHTEIGRVSWERQVEIVSRNHRFATLAFAPPLVLVAIFGEYTYEIFGEKWAEVSQILPYFCVMAFVNAVSNVTSFFTAFRLFIHDSLFNIALLVLKVGVLGIASIFLEPYIAINAFALAATVGYLCLNFYWGRKLNKTREFCLNYFWSILLAVLTALVATTVTKIHFVTGVFLSISLMVILAIVLIRIFFAPVVE